MMWAGRLKNKLNSSKSFNSMLEFILRYVQLNSIHAKVYGNRAITDLNDLCLPL